ncbi:hypothetical protein QZH41_012437, partial [Actinostola sp. cb2023]
MDHIEFWLSFVQSASVQQEHDDSLNTNEDINCHRHFQPVFLVGTHADKPFDSDNPANLAQKVLHRLGGKANADSQCLVRKIYTVNNRVSGSGEEDEDVKKLRDDILEEVEKLPYINEDIPIRWLRFKSELSSLVKSSKKRYLSLVEAKEIASKCTIGGDEFDTLLNYLHDLKSIIYFEDTKLVIIDIQWLLDVFVKVVTVPLYTDWEVKYEKSWRKLEEDGILEKSLVEHLWHDIVDESATKQLQLQEPSLTSNSHEAILITLTYSVSAITTLDDLDIVPFISENRLSSIPASEAANTVAEMLKLDTATMADPPADMVKKVRILCRHCIKHDRVDIVKELRKTLPSGMTG